MTDPRLPGGQQWAAPGKWPLVGERLPDPSLTANELTIEGCCAFPQTITLEQIASLPPTTLTLDIHCVTRWSQQSLTFRGVLLRDLLAQLQPTPSARFVAYIARSTRLHSTSMPLADALDLGTLLATHADGEPLSIEHGGPLRVITPGRYFYKSLKWLMKIELLAEDRLGYWEAAAGYHNHADPWQEERYIASSLSRADALALVTSRDLSGKELLSLDLCGHELSHLKGQAAILRNSNFNKCQLLAADFSRANLSNATFCEADLRGARFREADLEGASFGGANLVGADLRGASLLGCTFMSGVAQPTCQIDRTTQFSASALTMLSSLEAEFIVTRAQVG